MSVAVQPSVGVQCDLGQESQPDVVDQEVQCDLGQESQPRVTSDIHWNRPWITGSEARRFPVRDYLNSETGDDTVASTLVVHGIPKDVPQREDHPQESCEELLRCREAQPSALRVAARVRGAHAAPLEERRVVQERGRDDARRAGHVGRGAR